MLRRVAFVITDVSEELSASFIKVTRIELGTRPALTSNRRTLRRNTLFQFCGNPVDTLILNREQTVVSARYSLSRGSRQLVTT
jgi:hypothetical protein